MNNELPRNFSFGVRYSAFDIRHLISYAAILAISLFAVNAAAQSPEKIDQDLAKLANDARNSAKAYEVITRLDTIITGNAASVQQKITAFNIIFDLHSRSKKYGDAASAAAKICEAVPGNAEVRKTAILNMVNMYANAQQFDKAIENARQFLAEFPDVKGTSADMRVRLASYLSRKKDFAGSLAESERAMGQSGDDDRLMAEALVIGMDSAAQAKNPEKEFEFVTKLKDDKYLKVRNQWEHFGIRMRYANCLRRTGNLDETIRYCAEMEKITENQQPDQRQSWCKMIADMLVDKKAPCDEIVRQCDKVFTDHPSVSHHWYSAQQMIAEAYLREKKFNEALSAAKVLFDASDEQWKQQNAGRIIYESFKQMDGKEDRAKVFSDYQTWGPEGDDEKKGTEDDLKNPMDGIGYPAYPGREKAFAQVMKACGDNSSASRHRGLMEIYSAHPRKALLYFIDGARRASCDDFGPAALDMIRMGARSLKGCSADMDEFYLFVVNGPNGADGKAGTDDDVKDPFAALLGPELKLSSGNGGMAMLADAELKNLREVQDFLKSMAVDELTKGRDRRDVILSIERIHEALLDWDDKDLRQWYAFQLSNFERNDVEDALFNGYQLAIRSSRYDLGDLKELWKSIDGKSPDIDKLVSAKTVSRCQMQWNKTLKMLNVPPKPKPKPKTKPEKEKKK